MNATTHPVLLEEVMAFVDGQLPHERIEFVSKHVEECIECRSLAEEMRSSSERVKGWQVSAVPKTVETKVKAALPNQSQAFRAEKSPSWNWGLAKGVLVGGLSILLLGVIAIPNLLRSRMAANEASSVGSLRTINTAAVTYRTTYGHYPPSLKSLGGLPNELPDENAAHLIDNVLASGQKSGYVFVYRFYPAAEAGGEDGYSIDAQPLEPDKGGVRHFSTNQTGVILADGRDLDGGSSAEKFGGFAGHAKTGATVAQESAEQSAPMIARSAVLKVEVTEIHAARARMERILAEHKGYVAQLSAADEGNSARTVVASLRVPSASLDECVAQLKKLGRVLEESQSGEEVTQQHLDLTARIKNGRTTESKLNDVVQQRTGKVADVLEAEKEVARVRGELEQMEAELQTLEHRVQFAKIELKLAEEYKAQLSLPAPSTVTQVRNACVNGFRNAWESLLGIILFCAEAGPTLALWTAILFLPVRLLWRRYQKAHATVV
jgi:type II secretory pathway pseudopilin PulG